MAPSSAAGGAIAPPPPARGRRKRSGTRGGEPSSPEDGGRDGREDGGGDGGWHGGAGRGGGGDAGDAAEGPASRARLALLLALLGIGTLFGAFLLAYAVLRRGAEVWPPPGAPVPPRGLWMPTIVLLASSGTLARARRGGARWIEATLALGILFLLAQALLWRGVLLAGRSAASDAYGTIFYSLTGLHAAHVVGGLVVLFRTARRARLEPGSARTRVLLSLCTGYWHFMGGVWLVLFAVLYAWS